MAVAEDGRVESTVSCNCGKVCLSFPESAPRFRYSCLCEDCRQKAVWAFSQGGPAVPLGVMSYEKGFDTIYFGNNVTVTQGKEQLRFFKLRNDAGSTSCMAKCCKTGLMVDNAFYQGMCVLIQADIANVNTDMSEPPAFYGFTKDFPQDKLATLPELYPGDTSKDYVFANGGVQNFASSGNIKKWCDGNFVPPAPASETSTTFQNLQKEAGGVEVLDLIKGAAIKITL
eukprot:CAMPEP_0172827694 /NCGR_PEP_ID=MMETSP1075-20121228/20289_1 /TAXON_ID=2916 /ORGANISM="Ceratium fusus, Strain PA161109" /LENGTH=227 /DNA_ID=CAMNT_0013669545 /DNA_START=65 /DNA_END=748 /DNA_ORIENTATION=+